MRLRTRGRTCESLRLLRLCRQPTQPTMAPRTATTTWSSQMAHLLAVMHAIGTRGASDLLTLHSLPPSTRSLML